MFLHGLPEDQRGTYPFICIRWASGGIDEGVDGYVGAEGRETLALVIGMFAPEGPGTGGPAPRGTPRLDCGLSCAVTVWSAKKFELQLPAQSLRCRNLTGSGSNIITATVYPEYQYVIPSIPLGGTLKEHTYE